MKNFLMISLCAFVLPLIGGCDDAEKKAGTQEQAQAPAPVAQKVLTEEEIQEAEEEAADARKDTIDAWVGKWDGPEGTYMKIEKSGEGYGITIKDLDKEERFLGVREFLSIRFHRGDLEESIHLGAGRDSGMKWLKDKPYCLIVKKGEAYCRDEMKK